MKDNHNVAINFVGFQIGWFACVLSAANSMPEVGLVIALLVVMLHVYASRDRQNTIQLLLVVTLLGSAWDSILTYYQVLVFSSGILTSYLAPSWIVMMWLLFATTLTISFRWLYGRYILASVLGAVFGPLTYQAGKAMGAVIIPDVMLANIILMLSWALIFPLLIKVAEFYQTRSQFRLIKKSVSWNT